MGVQQGWEGSYQLLPNVPLPKLPLDKTTALHGIALVMQVGTGMAMKGGAWMGEARGRGRGRVGPDADVREQEGGSGPGIFFHTLCRGLSTGRRGCFLHFGRCCGPDGAS